MKHRVDAPTKNGNCSAKDVVKAREKMSGSPSLAALCNGDLAKSDGERRGAEEGGDVG